MMSRLAVLYTTVLGEVTAENVGKSLALLGKGMLGIFVVIVLIYVVIHILNHVTKKEKEKSTQISE